MKRLLPVILLAGCPDPAAGTTPPPPDHVPSGPCAGFGLSFTGPQLSDVSYLGLSDAWRGAYGSEPKPIATGGVESISVYGTPRDDMQIQHFDAAVNGPALAIDVPGPFSSGVPVTGVASGLADLCIYDPGADTVHDGRRLAVRDVASMFATPAASYYWHDEAADGPYPFASWRMHTGPERWFGVGLVSAEGWRLVDTGMTIEVAIGDAPPVAATRGAWDTAEVDVTVPTSVRLHVTLSSGETHDAVVGVVDRVDRLVRRPPGFYDDLTKLAVGGSWARACFDVFADGARVFGAPYVFTATSQVSVTPSPFEANCVQIEPVEPGNGALTVQVDDQILELPLVVAPDPNAS